MITEPKGENSNVAILVQNQLADLSSINLSNYQADLWEEDVSASNQINEQLQPKNPNDIFIVDGAAPHVVASVIYAKKANFDVHIMVTGNLKSHEPSERRTASAIKGLGYESTEDFIKILSTPINGQSRSGIAVFILERTDHGDVGEIRNILGKILLNTTGKPSSLNVIGEGIEPENARSIENSSQLGKFDTIFGSRKIIAEYSYKNSIPLKVASFTPHVAAKT
jgi:hypothetical protein